MSICVIKVTESDDCGSPRAVWRLCGSGQGGYSASVDALWRVAVALYGGPAGLTFLQEAAQRLERRMIGPEGDRQ